jgi:hypothetical protein
MNLGATSAQIKQARVGMRSLTDLVWARQAATGPWVLVIDNADQPELLAADGGSAGDGNGVVRGSEHGLVLVTSRVSAPEVWGARRCSTPSAGTAPRCSTTSRRRPGASPRRAGRQIDRAARRTGRRAEPGLRAGCRRPASTNAPPRCGPEPPAPGITSPTSSHCRESWPTPKLSSARCARHPRADPGTIRSRSDALRTDWTIADPHPGQSSRQGACGRPPSAAD